MKINTSRWIASERPALQNAVIAKPDIEICELLAELTKSVTLHTTGHVNGVTEETVTRHC